MLCVFNGVQFCGTDSGTSAAIYIRLPCRSLIRTSASDDMLFQEEMLISTVSSEI